MSHRPRFEKRGMKVNMQKSKIEWTDYVWNPVTGCEHQCPYCYARKMANRLKGRYGYPEDEPFRPTLHAEKLREQPPNKPSKIFVCSMGDLFGEFIPKDWITTILKIIKDFPEHTYIFLTKNPKRYSEFDFPKNVWIGYSTTGTLYHDWDERHKDNIKFISIEPMMDNVVGTGKGLLNTNWIIIGAETGNRKGKVKLQNQWIYDALELLDKLKIPVFIKNNAGGVRQDYPMDAQVSIASV